MIRAVLFAQLQTAILGPTYDLSVAFLSPAQMRAVTKRTKNKNKASNVLAFPLSKILERFCSAKKQQEAKQKNIA